MKERNKTFYFFVLCIIMLLGIILRIKTYLLARPLWHDECSLALNVLARTFTGFFSSLEHGQSAPPLFMILTKLNTLVFGLNELVWRLIPFISSIMAIPLFYIFTKRIFENRFSILTANLLFAVNYNLIYYSQEFKQYSSDTAICLGVFLICTKLNLEKFSLKNCLLTGIVVCFISLLSVPSLFIFAAFCIYELISDKKKIEKIILLALPPVILWLGYLPFIQNNFLQNYWQGGFINFDNWFTILKTNLLFWFFPNNMIFASLLLLISGFICYKHKKEYYIIFLILLFALLSSILHIYPLLERVSLYLIPFVIAVMIFPLEKFSVKNYTSIIIVALILISFWKYDPCYIKSFFSYETFNRMNGKNIMKILSSKYKESEYVLINNASLTDYLYYSIYYKFNTQNFGIINFSNTDTNYSELLNTLPPNDYWFFVAFDYSHTPALPVIKDWKQYKKVLFETKNNQVSYLLHIIK